MTKLRRPLIVVLAGDASTTSALERARVSETLAGHIAIVNEIPRHSITAAVRHRLDALTFSAIALADQVLITDDRDALSEGARQAIAMAELLDKPVRYAADEPHLDPRQADMFASLHRNGAHHGSDVERGSGYRP